MIEYIQFFYRMLFSGLMHENPMRCICTHPWLQLALWGRCLCDLSWWVCSTQKHWVCGSPCNSYPVCTAADAALDIKLTFHWISLFLFALLFLLHGILHQSASVVHLIFFIPMSPSSLGLNLYIVLFFHSFLSSFLSSFFLLFFFFFLFSFLFSLPTKQKIAFQGEKLLSPCAFTLKSTSNWGVNTKNQLQYCDSLKHLESSLIFRHASFFSHIHNQQYFLFFTWWSSSDVTPYSRSARSGSVKVNMFHLQNHIYIWQNSVIRELSDFKIMKMIFKKKKKRNEIMKIRVMKICAILLYQRLSRVPNVIRNKRAIYCASVVYSGSQWTKD